MNKHIIKSFLTFAAAALMCAGCETDHFNETYLDGWEPSSGITDVQNISFALTDEDYTAIANNKTNQSIASEAGASDVLAAIGTNKYFATKDDAAAYIPAYLSANYPTLDNTSTAMVSYTCALDLPENVAAMNAMKEIKNLDYTKVWGEGSKIEYLTPATESKLTDALPTEGLEAGDYVAVTYKYAATEPTASETEPKSVYRKVTTFDGNGSYLLIGTKNGKDYAMSPLAANKNYGYASGKKLTISSDDIESNEETDALAWTITKTTDGKDTYTIQDGVNQHYYYMDDNESHVSFQKSATLGEGNYAWEIAIDKEGNAIITNVGRNCWIQHGDGTYTSFGSYPTQRGTNPRLYKLVQPKAAKAGMTARADVATEKRYAVYTWDGSKFNPTENAVLQPSDYTAMGQKYGNFTDPDQDVYLPQYLTANYPYGKADDVKYVSYLRYKNKKTNWATDEYVFDGMKWAKRSYFETREDQFVKSKKQWNYNPSIVWFIEYGKSKHPATEFFQACVDWVYENIDKPLGSTGIKEGKFYITSYGNNDYYTGASAYQGNLDWRPASAMSQYADGYKGMSNEEILKAMQEHTAEVFAAVLPQFYPDLAPIDGIDVTLTVQCGVYDGSATTYYNFVFKVVGAAKYEFQSFAPVE